MSDTTEYVPPHDGDEPLSNRSGNPHFSTVIERRLSRRQMLGGSLGAAVGLFAAAAAPKAEAYNGRFLPPAAQGRPPFALNPCSASRPSR
jgi:uncharacterized protein